MQRKPKQTEAPAYLPEQIKHSALPRRCALVLPQSLIDLHLRGGGRSVQLPCATSAAMPMLSPSVGCG